ncbi:MAG: hypothetical protein EZS28_009975 [Streblomastix strix]|uniref:Reverse transcriptase RNase H-like domain-containing protein n=1 Tax=Streblomastix strix TaxID=222440 RepID=A0A5J4WJK7_9EUKA|nr:MAG: hypothetical protein EZS28_009975 [Streblomastix strix]
MEWEDQANQENYGRPDLVDGVNQIEYSERIRVKGTQAENDNECSGVWMGSCSGNDNNRRRSSSRNRRMRGTWNLKSSNWGQLAAVLMGVRKLRAFILRNSCLVIRTDNVVTEFAIRKWKTKGELLQLARKIRQEADALSRLARIGDYAVKKEYLYPALAELELNDWLDAFATRTNKLLEEYCSLFTRPSSIRPQRIQLKLEEPEAIATSTNSADTQNSRQSTEGWCRSRDNFTRLEGTDMGITDEGIGNERSSIGMGRRSSGEREDNGQSDSSTSTGKIKAIRLISTLKENEFSKEWPHTQDLMIFSIENMLLVTRYQLL